MAKYAGRELVLTIGITDVTVGQVTSLGSVGSQRDLIDASAYGDDWKDYVVGQQDGNEVEIGLAYDPADSGQDAMETAYGAGTSTHFELVHTTAGFHVQFEALVTKWERGGDRDGLLTATAALKILNPGVSDVP